MKISVVIPTYNRAAFLAETLDAIFAQTLAADEIIIVDDGSTDNTDLVLKRYAQRLKVIRIQNSGDLVARNIGLDQATGDLVAFCDSDDIWDPKFLQSMRELWRAEAGIVAGYCNFRILKDGKLAEETKFSTAPGEFFGDLRKLGDDLGVFDAPIVERMVAYQPFFPSCMMVDRVAFQRAGGWDQSVRRGSDFATTLRCGALPLLGICLKPLVSIRKHGSNLSGDTEKMNLGDALVLEHVLATRPDISRLRPSFLDSANRRRSDALHGAFSRRDFKSVLAIDGLMHGSRSVRHRAKVAISSLPAPINLVLANVLSRSSERPRHM